MRHLHQMRGPNHLGEAIGVGSEIFSPRMARMSDGFPHKPDQGRGVAVSASPPALVRSACTSTTNRQSRSRCGH